MSNEWKPIDTAPKDGEHILAYEDGMMVVCWWGRTDASGKHQGWCFGASGDGDWMAYPTASPDQWMPLPAPPGQETSE